MTDEEYENMIFGRNAEKIKSNYKTRQNAKGYLTLVAAIILMGFAATKIPDTRFGWVEADYHTVQGNFVGLTTRSQKNYLQLYTTDGLESFEIAEGVVFKLPKPGGMLEVHYSGEQYPKILQRRDVKILYVPNPEKGMEGFTTPYGVLW